MHDDVRGLEGCYARLREGLARLNALDSGTPRRVSRSVCFTISPWSVRSLGEMPDVVRSLVVGEPGSVGA